MAYNRDSIRSVKVCELDVYVRTEDVGFVIGKNGATLELIKRETRVDFIELRQGDCGQYFLLRGFEENVLGCAEKVREIATEAYRRNTQGVKATSAKTSILPDGIETVQETGEYAQRDIGMLIGAKGTTINAMKRRFSIDAEVLKTSDVLDWADFQDPYDKAWTTEVVQVVLTGPKGHDFTAAWEYINGLMNKADQNARARAGVPSRGTVLYPLK